MQFNDFASRYYWTRLNPLKCCGCFGHHFGSVVACFIWAGLSFYFAILAFMNKSPFYSYLSQVPLVIFGVVNLIFGCVSLAGFITVLTRPTFGRVRSLVYVIAVTAIAVLIDMLVNFILFVLDPGTFQFWCIDTARANVLSSLQQQQPNSTLTVSSGPDYYNCDRVYADQVKWSLLCLAAMYIVYIHWVLVFASFAGTSFVIIPPRGAAPPPPPPPPPAAPQPAAPAEAAATTSTAIPQSTAAAATITETMSNLPPSSSKKEVYYRNLKPFAAASCEKSRNSMIKASDINLLSTLGLKVDDRGQIIHISGLNQSPDDHIAKPVIS